MATSGSSRISCGSVTIRVPRDLARLVRVADQHRPQVEPPSRPPRDPIALLVEQACDSRTDRPQPEQPDANPFHPAPIPVLLRTEPSIGGPIRLTIAHALDKMPGRSRRGHLMYVRHSS